MEYKEKKRTPRKTASGILSLKKQNKPTKKVACIYEVLIMHTSQFTEDLFSSYIYIYAVICRHVLSHLTLTITL